MERKLNPSTHYGADPLSQKPQMKGQKGYKAPSSHVKAHGNHSSNKTFYPFMGSRKHLGSTNKSGGGYNPKNNAVYLGKNPKLGRQNSM